ncbi:MAG: branched-chain amino acid ABC transporter permease, partial [Rhodospirillales bacterium]|nr:branched-chain amino acid ABC transporter permease [Rhodospirillales bacterium]
MDLGTFLQSFSNAIALGSIYAMVAVGLALAFGVMQMANFAHGEFFMLGSYVVYVLYAIFGLSFPAAVILAFPI